MKTKTTISVFLFGTLVARDLHGQVLAPTPISASNVFKVNPGDPYDYSSRGDAYLNFIASSANGTWGVWRTDGTQASTRAISNVPLGYSAELVGVPGMLFFTDGKTPSKLYTSNGTPNSGTLIPTTLPGPKLGYGSALGNNYVFRSDRTLYRTNGVSALLELKRFISVGTSFCTWNGKVYFSASDVGGNNELWVTDGTAAGTMQFKDILPGNDGSDPKGLQVIGNKLYFTAVSRNGGQRELWVSSGTAFNTMLIKEVGRVEGKFHPLAANSNAFPQKFYFAVGPEQSTSETLVNHDLWESNGTPEGTRKVSFANILVQGELEVLPVLNGTVRFVKNNPQVPTVYRMSVTGGGLIPEITTANIEKQFPAHQRVNGIGICNGKLFFKTGEGLTGVRSKLWALNGTTISEVRPSDPQTTWITEEMATQYFIHNSWLYFSADVDGGGRELYKVQ